MTNREDIQKELRELSSIVPAGISPEERLPDGYMDELESAILQKTIHKKDKSSRLIWLKWAPAIAASLVILLSAILWLRPTSVESNFSPEIGSEDMDQIIAFLSDQDVMSYSTISSSDLDILSEDAFEELDLEEVKTYMADQLDEFDTALYSDINWE
jgi:hypothetical protein